MQSSSTHNRVLGQRIRHPPSTNFNEDFPTPNAKRLKRLDSNDSDNALSQKTYLSENDEEEVEIRTAEIEDKREVLDSDAESDLDHDFDGSPRKTDLESALPPVKTDKEAIREYEATRAAETVDLDLGGRLRQRKWIQGKSSIYVDAFNLALETVLDEEAHLFNDAELTVFDNWRSLSYEGQYLYVGFIP